MTPTYDEIFSIEQLPMQNASAVIMPQMRRTFREAAEQSVMKTPEGYQYIPWGADDQMPYDIINLIEQDETLSTCQIWNTEMTYGAGLEYITDEASKNTQEEVKEFFEDNDIPSIYLGTCQDIKYFDWSVLVIYLSRDLKKIVSIQRKEACYCRLAPADQNGNIPYIIYGNFRSQSTQKFEKITLLNQSSQLADLMTRTGRRRGNNGEFDKQPVYKYAMIIRFPGVDSLYYPIPHYASLFRGSWYAIKRLIGIAKEAKLKNAAPIKYIIEISNTYWEEKFRDKKIVDPEQRKKLVKQRKEEIMQFLTATENTGSALFTGTYQGPDGQEHPNIKITSVDSKTKEGGDWESDIAEAINMICFTMHVHSNLVGSVPGKSQTNNSGSDKRELYTIAQALQKPYHDIIFRAHQIIIKYNGWDKTYPQCRLIQLTTLDEHRDAKTVTV